MQKWFIDDKETQTLSGAAVKWFDHRFFELKFDGKKYHGELVADHSETGQLIFASITARFRSKKDIRWIHLLLLWASTNPNYANSKKCKRLCRVALPLFM